MLVLGQFCYIISIVISSTMDPKLIALLEKENRTKKYILAAVLTFIFFIIGIIPAVIAVSGLTNPFTRIADGFCIGIFLLLYIICLTFIFWRDYTSTKEYKLLTKEQDQLKDITLRKTDTSDYLIDLKTTDNKNYSLKCNNKENAGYVCEIVDKKLPGKVKSKLNQ